MKIEESEGKTMEGDMEEEVEGCSNNLSVFIN